MICTMCSVGYHTSCTPPCSCADAGHERPLVSSLPNEMEPIIEDTDDDSDDNRRNVPRNVPTRTVSSRANKRDALLKDQQSTGRKRAAKMYPLDPKLRCEWWRKANCGGGDKPIIGCVDGYQQARHHGPDKNVTNNEEGNVHRICHACHYRWHAANDPTYDWNSTLVTSHEPRPQTNEEFEEATMTHLKFLAKGVSKIKD